MNIALENKALTVPYNVRSVSLENGRNEMLNGQHIPAVQMEPVNFWDHISDQQHLNQILTEWFHQALPPGQVLGLILIYVKMNRANSQVFMTAAQQVYRLTSNSRTLIFRPGVHGPFILNPLIWLFSILLWAFWCHSAI